MFRIEHFRSLADEKIQSIKLHSRNFREIKKIKTAYIVRKRILSKYFPEQKFFGTLFGIPGRQHYCQHIRKTIEIRNAKTKNREPAHHR